MFRRLFYVDNFFIILDTSASESFDQTFESSSCIVDDDECCPLSTETKLESNLNKSISPLRLPPAKLNLSQESLDDLSQKSTPKEIIGKYEIYFYF